MHKSYFLSHNNVKSGPFDFDQLKKQQLLAHDLIWCPEFGDTWKRIDEIESLANHIVQTPPPTPKEKRKNVQKKEISTVLRYFLFTFLVIGVIAFGALYDWLLYSIKHRYKNEVSDVFIYSFLYLSTPLSFIITYMRHKAIIKKYVDL